MRVSEGGPPVVVERSADEAGAAPASWQRLHRVSSSTAKNEFASLVHRVEGGEAVVVMRHERPAVVILPVAEFEVLKRVAADRLEELTRKYDADLDEVNAPAIWTATSTAFHTPLDEPLPSD
ncbi:MAG: type II toxin-antitoxin system prevent-host-death family antitoxin [Gemmatimonadaceae bacterium]|nr:type II toxin-antitoxin system prevent-host-death family antitoxin [Gemmatimonadaceae bacterium]